MSLPILHTESLSIGYSSKKPLINNVSLSIGRGSLVCLMGPNGVGKTTLLRTMASILPPLSGTVKVEGKSLSILPASERARQISVVLTDPVNAGAMSGLEIISIGRHPYRSWSGPGEEDQHRIREAVDVTSTAAFMHQPFHELSDGQRQKILIARAVAQDCPLMLLDEPNSHLDLNNRVEIMKMLKSLTRTRDKSVLMATHELDLALQMADRIWLMDGSGRIMSGIPEDLVLSGVIDKAFTLKGFDLKTGRVEHEMPNILQVQLSGTGYLYLWTKNALERNGISLSTQSDIMITIDEVHDTWTITSNGNESSHASIEDLILSLVELSKKA